MLLPTVAERLNHIPETRHREVGQLMVHFLDTIATATPRASFYTSRNELVEAAGEVHKEFMNLDRGLYGLFLAFPGTTDWSKQIGAANLLSSKWAGQNSFLTLPQESRVIEYLSESLPITRRLKLFRLLRSMKVNNARTRNLILRSIMNDPDIEWRALKYRSLLQTALTHAWGKRRASIMKSILDKAANANELNETETGLVKQLVFKFVEPTNTAPFESLRFILGSEKVSGKFKAWYDANKDFDALAELPPEVAEGKRSVFHPDHESGEVLGLTKDKLTAGQKIAVQRSAKKKGVKVDMDPLDYDPVRLYIYAFEMGFDQDIQAALAVKAAKAAKRQPWGFQKTVIVVDCSRSMIGGKDQKNRPIAVSLALRDLIMAASNESVMAYAGEEVANGVWLDHVTGGAIHPTLPEPSGHTDLARPLVECLQMIPDAEAAFVLSDGFENAPAGRFAETVAVLRKIGYDLPIYQLSPTFESKVYGTKALSDDVTVMPVSSPSSLGLGMIKMLLETDLFRGLDALLNVISPRLLPGGKS